MRTDNPAHGVMRYADGRRQRRLSDDEYALLGEGLRQAESLMSRPRALATGWQSPHFHPPHPPHPPPGHVAALHVDDRLKERR